MTMLPRAALLGLATGSRSSFGLAALAMTAASKPESQRHAWLTSRWTGRAAALAAAAEVIGDKLPKTPSRLEPAGFLPRLVFGGLGGSILSYRQGHPIPHLLASAAVGAMAAAIGAQLGASWRTLAADQFDRDLPGALAEDCVAVAVAALAVRH
jgi:uncharacterized membrane protein